MNRRFRNCVQVLTLSLVLFLTATAKQDTQNTVVRQQLPSHNSLYKRTIEYSRSSISFFLKNVFNLAPYPQEYLARNFSHVVQGISLAPKHTHPRKFIKKVLNLFSIRLHDLYVNPYAFCSFLEKLILYSAPYTDPATDREYLIEVYIQAIGACLSDRFDQLRDKPEETLHQLACKLYELSQLTEDQDISVRELQHSIQYFLTRGLTLVTWSPVDQEDAWYIMMNIAGRIDICVAQNLIDHEMADDLYWLLVNQFTVFLSVAGPELSSSFFEAASSSLANANGGFWNGEERELYIKSKFECLKEALMQAEASSKLHTIGYVTA